MGYYINPKDGKSKEEWLRENARCVREDEMRITAGELPVIWIDNGPFTAAGIAFSERELLAFTRADDPRDKKFFMCSRECLAEFLPAQWDE